MIEKRIKNDLTLKRWRRFKSHKSAIVSIWILVIFTIMTFMAPMIANNKPLYMSYKGESYFPVFKTYQASEFGVTDSLVIDYRKLLKDSDETQVWPIVKWNPFESNENVEYYPSKPTSENWFGTDDRGRDVFSRLVYGFKYSIGYAVLVWALSFSMGIVVGGIMGYFGGWVDLAGQRLVEILQTVPTFFLLLILVASLTPNLWWLVVISSIFGWIPISHYVRAEFLKNRKQEFVEAARSMGASTPRLIFKHLLPNSLTPIVTFSPFVISGNIIGLASLDYLGFGLPVPTPSWGELLAQAQKNFVIAWWLAVFPAIALFVTLVVMNIIGEAVRDAFDPRK